MAAAAQASTTGPRPEFPARTAGSGAPKEKAPGTEPGASSFAWVGSASGPRRCS
jgi:hypothetical protein